MTYRIATPKEVVSSCGPG